jgi:hypothetical protein
MSKKNDLEQLFSALFRETEEICDTYERIPGLLRSWELEQVLRPGSSYIVRDGGRTADGMPLFTIYRERLAQGARA